MGYFLQQLINGLTLGMIYGLIAIGYTMVYGIIGMINFAHGEIFMIGSFIAIITFMVLGILGLSWVPLALLIVLMVVFTLMINRTAFGRSQRACQQGIVAGNFLADEFGSKKIAILHDKTAYGKGLADETKKQLNKRGIKETMYEAYTAGEKDYSALVSKMKGAGVDVFYLGGYHTEAGLMIRQAREQGYGVQLVSGDALVTDEFWKITGPAGEGTLMTFSPDPRKNPVAAPVVEKFRSGGYEPEGYTLYTYGAIQAWAQAAEKAGSTDTMALVKSLRANKFDTVLGNIGFDPKGDVTAPGYVSYDWKNGTYDYVK